MPLAMGKVSGIGRQGPSHQALRPLHSKLKQTGPEGTPSVGMRNAQKSKPAHYPASDSLEICLHVAKRVK